MPQRIDKPNPQQQEWLDQVKMGLTPTQAAAAAGYKDPSHTALRLIELPWAKAALAKLRRKQEKQMRMSREKVQQGLIDAIEMAKLKEDPQSMIRGWAEIAKLLGYYAPERKEVTVTGKIARIQAEFEQLPDERLLEMLADEDPNLIEGVFHEIEDDPKAMGHEQD